MYVQVITFSLEGITEEEYLDAANQLAARTAGVPGLLAKLWLENESGNRYGGIYFWEDVESMQRFADSDLFEGRVQEFGDAVIEEFGVLENLTAMTQPVLEILDHGRRGVAAEAVGEPRSTLVAPPDGATGRSAALRKRTPPPPRAPGEAGAEPTRKSTARKSAPAARKPTSKARKGTARTGTGRASASPGKGTGTARG